MNRTTPQLTRDNLKVIGVPEQVHADVKMLAARDRVSMYAVIIEAVRLYKALHQDGDNHASPKPVQEA